MHTALRFENFFFVRLLSVLGTFVNSNISNQAVDGRVLPDSCIADRRDTEGVVADEKGMVEEQEMR